MKIPKIAILPFVLYSCGAPYRSKLPISYDTPGNFTVYKIDSVKNVYFIYAKKQDANYKILSLKSSSVQGEPIKLNGNYTFMLETIFTQRLELVEGIMFHGVAVDNTGDSQKSLHIAHNLKGLRVINR